MEEYPSNSVGCQRVWVVLPATRLSSSILATISASLSTVRSNDRTPSPATVTPCLALSTCRGSLTHSTLASGNRVVHLLTDSGRGWEVNSYESKNLELGKYVRQISPLRRWQHLGATRLFDSQIRTAICTFRFSILLFQPASWTHRRQRMELTVIFVCHSPSSNLFQPFSCRFDQRSRLTLAELLYALFSSFFMNGTNDSSILLEQRREEVAGLSWTE